MNTYFQNIIHSAQRKMVEKLGIVKQLLLNNS